MSAALSSVAARADAVRLAALRCTESVDVDEHSAAFSQWDQRYDQLSPGRFHGRVEELAVADDVALYRESTNRAVLTRGSVGRPGQLTLAVVVDAGGPVYFDGASLGRGALLRVVGDDEILLRTSSEIAFDAVTVELDALAEHIERVHARRAQPLIDRLTRVETPCDPDGAFARLLDAALSAPRATAGGGLPGAATGAIRDDMLEAIVRLAERSGSDAGTDADGASPATRRRIAHRAFEYLFARLDCAISVGELCHVIGTSRRTLQTSFQEVFGLNPCGLMRTIRLNALRRELRDGLAEGDTIGDAAARHGLWHPSRLAAEYRALFDELPSATVARGRAAALRARAVPLAA